MPVMEGFRVASINGLILEKWLETGGPDGVLGFPIADEAGTPDGVGRFSTFEWGSLYWSPSTGAHPVYGPTLAKWAASGYEAGQYGYPIADTVGDEDGGEYQDFQYGRIDSPAIPFNGAAYQADVDGKHLGINYDKMLECINGYDTGILTVFHRTGESLNCKDFRHIYERHMPEDISLKNWDDFQACVAHTLASSEPFEPKRSGTYGRTRYNTYTNTRSSVIIWENTKYIHTAYTNGEGGRNWGGCRRFLAS